MKCMQASGLQYITDIHQDSGRRNRIYRERFRAVKRKTVITPEIIPFSVISGLL